MASTRVIMAIAALTALVCTGCAGSRGYDKAFSSSEAVAGNSHQFEASAAQTFQAVKFTLVQQGFLIEQADVASGLIKATRNLDDPSSKKISYNVNATVDVSGTPDGRSSLVTMAANQQTVTHSKSHNWVPILGPLMIPTSTNYQTTVTGEGTITNKSFYGDFFAAVDRSLREAAATPAVPVRATEPAAAPAIPAAAQPPAQATAASPR